MNDLSQADFTKAMQAATERLWHHRKTLRRVAMKLGFWPDGLVISANITARNNDEMKAGAGPRVIPWPELATLTEARAVEIVDELCAPLYPALGMKQGENVPATAQVIFGRGPNQVAHISGFTAAEFGIPTVTVGGCLDGLEHMTPARADEFADGLKAAARLARGEAAA